MPRKKTIREQSLEELLPFLLAFGNNTLSESEQTLLKEVLINNKTFFELIPFIKLTTFRQKQVFNGAVKHLSKILNEAGKKQGNYNKYQELARELAEVKEKLEALQNTFNKPDNHNFTPEFKELLSTPIDKVGFSARVVNICSRAGIGTIFDLIKYKRTDFLKHRDSGKKSADEVEAFLKSKELFWNIRIETMYKISTV